MQFVQRSRTEGEVMYEPNIEYSGIVANSSQQFLQSDCDWVMIASLNHQHAKHTIAPLKQANMCSAKNLWPRPSRIAFTCVMPGKHPVESL
jgi:hypothetical protein